MVTIDPAGRDGPRPGAAPRAHRRRRLRAPLRDRRRRGVRHARATRSTSRRTGAARRSTAPTAGSRCTRRSISEDAGSLLPDQVRPALLWTITHGRRGRAHRRRGASGRGCGAGPSSTTRARSSAIDDGTADESLHAAQGGRRAPAQARGGPRRRLAAAARAGGRHRRVGVGAGVPRPAAGRGVERPDVAAHRLRGGVADDVRAGRLPPHPAAARPARRRSGCTAPRTRWASTGRPSCCSPTSSAASTRPRAAARRDGPRPAPGCCGAAATSPSTARRRPSRCTARSTPSTPT